MHMYDEMIIAGLVLCFVGFAMVWTDRTFGLAQVLLPDLYEVVGRWVIRGGAVLAFVGSLVHVIASVL